MTMPGIRPGADRAAAGGARRALCALAALAVPALGPLAAAAQTCSGPVENPPAVRPAAADEKFRLIAAQCDVLEEPVTVRRAAQLDLFERGPASIRIDPFDPQPAPAAAQRTQPRSSPPTRDEARVIVLAPAITAAARTYGLDPLLLHAIAHVESRHNPQAVSPAGARGAMQVMPATARRFGVNDPERSLMDADTNVRAGAALLQTLERRYDGDTRLTLAAYNAGEGAVEKFGRRVPPYPETEAYVRDVMAAHRRLLAEFEVSADGNIVTRARP